ncbi:MAG: hypothetical protein ACE14S_12340, partial [Candidatus Bathyarchaeia archaeon]
EPLTDWLTASRSTWLSYGGNAHAHALQVPKRLFKPNHSNKSSQRFRSAQNQPDSGTLSKYISNPLTTNLK